MIAVHRGMGAAVREVLRQHQAAELAAARRCGTCGKPVAADVRSRIMLVDLGRLQTADDLDLCQCSWVESVPTAGNAAMPSAPPRSLPQAGEGDGLRPAARELSTSQPAGPQGPAVATDSAPQISTARPGVRRPRPVGASCWKRLDCPACHGTGHRPEDPPGHGCPDCWQAFMRG